MQNDADNNIGTLEAEVRSAVEQNHDIQEAVRQLTLRRINARSLDIESLRQIAASVLRGARAAVNKEINLSAAQTETARVQLKQAVAGLDMALAHLAQASRLAIMEATGRAQKFSSEDLVRARADFESLETIFLETLQESVADAKDAAGDILHNIAEHARTHGTKAGEQIKETLDVITHQLGAAGHAQAVAGLHLAQATSELVRQIAAGVLTGLADHIKPTKTRAD
jgi:hypothetical protein